MKTLDEVIKMIEHHMENYCASEYDGPCLHYLKEYRDRRREIDDTESFCKHMMSDLIERKGRLRMYERNDPLTWDELKQMEGKPVWVEREKKGRWNIIREVTDNHVIFEIGLAYHKCWQGDLWQAYRKERE